MRTNVVGLSLLLALIAGCGTTNVVSPSACAGQVCGPSEVCDPGTGLCLDQALASPALEVLPPSGNNQGWVAQEFPRPGVGQEGKINLKLEAAVSIEGGVYASDDPTKIIPAQVIAWRESKLEGRPKVQFEASTGGKRDGGKETFVLWVNKGATYSLFVTPLPPYDADYPPLVVPSLQVTDHLKKPFMLDGADRAVLIKGQVTDYIGLPLNIKKPLYKNEKNVLLSASVRIRAFESDGLRRSTIGTTDPVTGAFSFKVPAGVATYDIRVESAGVLSKVSQDPKDPNEEGMPIPTLECKQIVLGLATSQGDAQPEQDIGKIQLPSFRFPEKFYFNVKGKDGTPVKGAAVTFTTEIKPLAANGNFASCSAVYTRTVYSDATGKVEILLLPASITTLAYAVTVVSPSDSPFASQWIKELEVGPSGGTLPAIELDRRYELSGQVVRKDTGEPVAGVTLQARGVSPGTDTAKVPVTTVSTTTDDEGKYQLFVDPGIHNLDLRPPQDSGLPSLGRTAIKFEGDVSWYVFKIPTPQVLLGMVRDPGGSPLPLATVQMYELVPEIEKPLTNKATLRTSSVTDGAGEFGLLIAPPQ